MSRPQVLLSCIRMHRNRDGALSGNFYYCLKLIEAIEALNLVDLHIHVDCRTVDHLAAIIPSERLITEPRSIDSILDMELSIRRAIKAVKPDLYHKPTGQLPVLPMSCRAIWGVADLNYRHLKLGFARQLYKQISYRLSALKAERIIAISHSTRDQIIAALHAPAQKVRTVYLGTTSLTAAPRHIDGLPDQFVITFGHHAHKNVETVIRALAKIRAQQPELNLLVIGSVPNKSQLEAVVDGLSNRQHVRFLGHVSEAQLQYLYSQAVCLAFLSRHEGFGLPVLEAMGSGCPVVASDAFALPEVCGTAAPLFDCDDVKGVSAEILRMMDNSEYRQAWIEKGFVNCQRFTWERTARETVEVYENVLGTEL